HHHWRYGRRPDWVRRLLRFARLPSGAARYSENLAGRNVVPWRIDWSHSGHVVHHAEERLGLLGNLGSDLRRSAGWTGIGTNRKFYQWRTVRTPDKVAMGRYFSRRRRNGAPSVANL